MLASAWRRAAGWRRARTPLKAAYPGAPALEGRKQTAALTPFLVLYVFLRFASNALPPLRLRYRWPIRTGIAA